MQSPDQNVVGLCNVSRMHKEMPMLRCPIISGTLALCFSASVRNCGRELSHNVAVECPEVRNPEAQRTENNSSGSSGGSPSASAFSINRRAAPQRLWFPARHDLWRG